MLKYRARQTGEMPRTTTSDTPHNEVAAKNTQRAREKIKALTDADYAQLMTVADVPESYSWADLCVAATQQPGTRHHTTATAQLASPAKHARRSPAGTSSERRDDRAAITSRAGTCTFKRCSSSPESSLSSWWC